MTDVTTIKPSKGWSLVKFDEIWRYRHLLYFLTVHGIKAKYAHCVLGVDWVFDSAVGKNARIHGYGYSYGYGYGYGYGIQVRAGTVLGTILNNGLWQMRTFLQQFLF